MKIATCLTADGVVGTPFEAKSICVYEQQSDGWTKVRDIAYFPVSDMGISHARLLLRGIASQVSDCEVFLVSELQGFTHVWLEELGFRTWKSEGSLMDQLNNVSAQDAIAAGIRERETPGVCASQSLSGGCGGSCGGACHSGASGKSIPEPVSVGEISARHFRIDFAVIQESDPLLNSRQVLIPVLEKKEFLILDIHFDHLPKWFGQTIDQLNLHVDVVESIPPEHGLDARVTVKA